MTPLINLKSLKHFLRSGQIGGFLLFFAVIISLLIANSSFGDQFNHILEYAVGFHNEHIHLHYPVEIWINDGLMAVFFLLVGLEIKRELLEGELSSFSKASLPIFAAIGGMMVPALLFLLINWGKYTAVGWGIPMATDIAFALAVISLLGKRVPASLKIFLAALAIADDLGAILVIAFFYTGKLHTDQLFYAGLIIALLIAFNRMGVKNLIFYLIPGLFLWYFIHHSGVHATIAGVVLAFTIPTNKTAEASPLERLEHAISNPVNFLIMPLFALANTSIRFESGMLEGLSGSLGLGIIFGLVIGKPLGISLMSLLAVKLGLGKFPSGAKLQHIIGLGFLGGIGFTMSIFIALLSYKLPQYQAEAKFAILVASLIAGITGYVILRSAGKMDKKAA